MDKTLSLSEAKIKLNRLVDDVSSKGDEIIITKNGKAAAVLVPTALYEGWSETKAIQSDPDFIKDIQQGLQRLKAHKKRYSFEDIFNEPVA